MIGAKYITEALNCVFIHSGRGAFYTGRRSIARMAGLYRSENAGMSSDKGSEKLPRRKSKVFWAMLINSELVGP